MTRLEEIEGWLDHGTPAEKAAIAVFQRCLGQARGGKNFVLAECATIIQAAIDETVKEVYSRSGYGPKPPEDAR